MVVCDINKSMLQVTNTGVNLHPIQHLHLHLHLHLQVGESRAASLGHTSGISWVEGDAQKLPFPDQSFDCYTIAFGIRWWSVCA